MDICLSLNPPVTLGPLATSTGSEVTETGDLDATGLYAVHISFVIYRTQTTARELSKE